MKADLKRIYHEHIEDVLKKARSLVPTHNRRAYMKTLVRVDGVKDVSGSIASRRLCLDLPYGE